MPTSDVIVLKQGAPGYPAQLSRIADPPERLYCRGDISLFERFCIGVVGTRRASDYGIRACRQLAGDLARAGLVIVSGLALGLDAVAHRAALDAAGGTIAVLGSGIGLLEPRENEPLGNRVIAEGGLVVSEYPGVMPGGRHTFPKRNRIISGLSRGVLVVEADRASGSLITASCALEQDRDVFAVPGSIYWPRSAGTNWLIQQGARPVLTVSDVLDAYRLGGAPLPETARLSTGDPLEQDILAVLSSDGPQHLDTLVVRTAADPGRVMAAVAMLELSGAVTHQGAGTYAMNR